MTKAPRICDYGDSSYRQDFWEGQGRAYEDAVERRVLAKLLPARGQRLLEIGAGFGRLTSEYCMYSQVVLLDYSLEQLQYARGRFGESGCLYIAADAYKMPFQPGSFDAATMIRVIHHFEDAPAVLKQVELALGSGGRFILEYANKRNLKAILRHLARRSDWDPFSHEPVEFVELNYNFHPDYMDAQLAARGFQTLRTLPVSWLRLGALKRMLPTSLLVWLDQALQASGWRVSPSIFLDLRLNKPGEPDTPPSNAEPLDILRCPLTGSRLKREGDLLLNAAGQRFVISDGVYDFRQPLN